MDNLMLQIKTVCLVSIFTGVIGAVVPSCRLKKAFNSFCAVVIVFSIMLPFVSFEKSADDFDFFDFESAERGMISESDTAEKFVYALVIENALNKRFSEMGLSVTVSVECEKTEGGYEIISFTVFGNEEGEKEKASAYLNEVFNGTPVNFEEEQDD